MRFASRTPLPPPSTKPIGWQQPSRKHAMKINQREFDEYLAGLAQDDPAVREKAARGLAVITYVQWLGSWLESYPYYEELTAAEAEE